MLVFQISLVIFNLVHCSQSLRVKVLGTPCFQLETPLSFIWSLNAFDVTLTSIKSHK